MNTLQHSKLFALVFLLGVTSLMLSACQGGGVLTVGSQPQVADSHDVHEDKHGDEQNGKEVPDERLSYEGVDRVIGQKLTDYADGMPVGNDIAKKRFDEMSELSGKKLEKLPLYSIEYDSKQLDGAVKFFEQKYGTFREVSGSSRSSGAVGLKSEDQEVLLVNGKRVLRLRRDTSTLEFQDRTLYSSIDNDVREENLDYNRLLSLAQSSYSSLFKKSYIDYSFFSNFDLLMNSIAQSGKEPEHTVGGVDLKVNPTIGKIPTLGSGAPAILSYLPNGELIGAYSQFVQFKEVKNPVTLISSEQAIDRLDLLMQQDGISLQDHKIKDSLFGYMFPSNTVPVKWLVPAYSFVVVPNEGVIDRGRVYSFPASKDPLAVGAYEENMRLINESFQKLYTPQNIHPDEEEKQSVRFFWNIG